VFVIARRAGPAAVAKVRVQMAARPTGEVEFVPDPHLPVVATAEGGGGTYLVTIATRSSDVDARPAGLIRGDVHVRVKGSSKSSTDPNATEGRIPVSLFVRD
jgi:hypothetical protein